MHRRCSPERDPSHDAVVRTVTPRRRRVRAGSRSVPMEGAVGEVELSVPSLEIDPAEALDHELRLDAASGRGEGDRAGELNTAGINELHSRLLS